jgi:hypothetical protein
MPHCIAPSSGVEYQYARAQPLFWDYNTDVRRSKRTTSHSPFPRLLSGDIAVFSIDPIELISGRLAKRQQRLVEAWAELHQAELLADWQRLQAGRSPLPIEPLK